MITFKNGDEVLQSDLLEYGTLPAYAKEFPTRPSTAEYEYTFSGWSPQITSVTEEAAYTAQFVSFKLNDYQSGEGSENNPYIILSAKQLKLFSDNVNEGESYTDTYFALGGDINLNGTEWTPIGRSSYDYFGKDSFYGHFDGKGYKITNFKITVIAKRDQMNLCNHGLFGYNKGIIKNLGIENFSIYIFAEESNKISAGGLAGHNSGTIANCYATGSIYVDSTSDVYAGGLVGRSNYGTITNCYATVDVDAHSGAIDAFAGGLVGHNNTSITNCFAAGEVSCYAGGSRSAYAGGLIGYNGGNGTNGSNGTITNCLATGDVSATAYI